MGSLYDLAEQIRRCTKCPLWKNRTLAVPGEGPEKARIMFVGEAPGAEEDRQGLPFVGGSGKFLEEMLAVAGLKRAEVFITGACKCRPPQNRIPAAKELSVCKQWLSAQIKAIKPELIVILGATALKSLLPGRKLKECQGKIIIEHQQKYLVIFHPAAGRRFPEIKEKMKQDFLLLGKLKN